MTNGTFRKAGWFGPLQELNRKYLGKVVHKLISSLQLDAQFNCKEGNSCAGPCPAKSARPQKQIMDDRMDPPSPVGLQPSPRLRPDKLEGWFRQNRDQKERPAGEGRARRHQEQSSTGVFWREDLQNPHFRGKNKPISTAAYPAPLALLPRVAQREYYLCLVHY